MNVLPSNLNYSEIEGYLQSKQQEVETRLKTIESEDPVLAQFVMQSDDPGAEAWEADAHVKSTAIKNRLTDLSQKIKTSLIKLQTGTYGVCDKCGHHIEKERLEALPIATMCTICVAILK